jgi:hypothetical protein
MVCAGETLLNITLILKTRKRSTKKVKQIFSRKGAKAQRKPEENTTQAL